jgi:integrase
MGLPDRPVTIQPSATPNRRLLCRTCWLRVISAAKGVDAVKTGDLARNPAALVDRPRDVDRPEKVIWEASDVARFLHVSDEDRLAGAWRLSLSGLRRGEVVGLRWADVDLDAGTVTVRRTRILVGGRVIDQESAKSKTSARVVPLTPSTVAALRRTKARQIEERLQAGSAYVDSGLVVVDEVGRPINPRQYGETFKILSARAAVPVTTLHTARHAYGSHLLDQGLPLPVVSKVMGHASVDITARTHAHALQGGADERVRAAMVAAGL